MITWSQPRFQLYIAKENPTVHLICATLPFHRFVTSITLNHLKLDVYNFWILCLFITHRLGCKHFQADYILGNNPMKMSYLVGYGSNYPQNVHHRGASIPVDANTTCKDGFTWLDSINPNPNVAVGAVVGGPFLNETYIDSRNNWMQAEPTTYNSALVVSLLSSLVRSSSVVDSFTLNRRM